MQFVPSSIRKSDGFDILVKAFRYSQLHVRRNRHRKVKGGELVDPERRQAVPICWSDKPGALTSKTEWWKRRREVTSVLNSEGRSMTNAAQRLNSLNVGTEKGPFNGLGRAVLAVHRRSERQSLWK